MGGVPSRTNGAGAGECNQLTSRQGVGQRERQSLTADEALTCVSEAWTSTSVRFQQLPGRALRAVWSSDRGTDIVVIARVLEPPCHLVELRACTMSNIRRGRLEECRRFAERVNYHVKTCSFAVDGGADDDGTASMWVVAGVPYEFIPAAALAEMYLGMQHRVRVTLGQVQETVERLLTGEITGEQAAEEVLRRAGVGERGASGSTDATGQGPGSNGDGDNTGNGNGDSNRDSNGSGNGNGNGNGNGTSSGGADDRNDGGRMGGGGDVPSAAPGAGDADAVRAAATATAGTAAPQGTPPVPPAVRTPGAVRPVASTAADDSCEPLVLQSPAHAPSPSDRLLFSLEDIGERLRTMGVRRLDIHPQRLVVRFSIRADDHFDDIETASVAPRLISGRRPRTQSMQARHSVQRTVLHLYTHFPSKVPVFHRADMARLVTRLNNIIAHGVLELNVPDGDVRYRTSIDYGDCEDKETVLAIFEQFVAGHRSVFAEYFDEIEACASGQIT